MSVSWDQRIIKPLVREKFVARLSKKGKKSAVVFPARQGFCVETLMRTGVIDKKTHIYSVERDSGIAKEFSSRIPALSSKIKQISDLRQVKKSVDFAWFDFCGILTDDIALYLFNNAHRYCSPNSDLFFTFQIANRAQVGFLTEWSEAVKNSDEGRSIIESVKNGWQYKTAGDESIYMAPLSDSFINSIASYIYAMRRLFVGYTFNVGFMGYKDRNKGEADHSTPMFCLHLSGFKYML